VNSCRAIGCIRSPLGPDCSLAREVAGTKMFEIGKLGSGRWRACSPDRGGPNRFPAGPGALDRFIFLSKWLPAVVLPHAKQGQNLLCNFYTCWDS